MKVLKFFALASILAFISACQTNEVSSKKSTKAVGGEFTSGEQKSYSEALESIKGGRPDSAISTLLKISTSHPEHIGAWINLANAYLMTKKIPEAESALAHAQAANPSIPEALNLHGLIDVEKGSYNNAERNYLAALKLKENYGLAHYNLALLYDIFYQEPEKAIPHYERYLELAGDGDKATKNWIVELKQKVNKRNGQ